MSIVTLPLPNQIANGQIEDAGPVMANMNYLANQVNLNAAPVGSVGGTNLVATGTSVLMTNSTFVLLPLGTIFNDAFNEIVGNTFVPANSGIYAFGGIVSFGAFNTTSGLANNTMSGAIFLNGVSNVSINVSWPYANSLTVGMSIPINWAITLTAGDVVDFRANMTFTGTQPVGLLKSMAIRRIA